jgi:predicted DNA-binding protein
MKIRPTTKQVSIRISAQVHESLTLVAEAEGTTVADIARQRILNAQKQIEIKDMLISLLNRLTKYSFEITSTVAGLDPDEKEAALLAIEKQLNRKIK